MQPDEMVQRLAAYRMDHKEATLYYHLSRLGGARASELARASGRSRTDVYKELEGLVARRFVAKSLERPVRYLPVPLEEVVKNGLEESSRELASLRAGADELLRAWPRTASRLDATADQYSVHQGMAQLATVVPRLIAGAKEDLFLFIPARFLAKLRDAGVLDELAGRARAGVLVRILTNLSARDPFLEGLAATCQIRHLHVPAQAALLAVDANLVALFISSGRSTSVHHSQETVLVVNAPDFVLGQRTLLDGSWRQGVDARARWNELDTKRMAFRVEVLRGVRIRNERLCAMAARAQHCILLEATASQARMWQTGSDGVGAELAAAAARGVDVRVVLRPVPGASDVPGPLPLFGATLEGLAARTAKDAAASSVPGGLAVTVDDQEFLFGWRPASLEAGGANPEAWALWTTDPLLGQHLSGADLGGGGSLATAVRATPGSPGGQPEQAPLAHLVPRKASGSLSQALAQRSDTGAAA